jgi:hypothetical protein
MLFFSLVTGTIMDIKEGKKGKRFMKIYDQNTSNLVTVFEKNPGDFKDRTVGEVVEKFPIKIISDNAFCQAK